MSVKDVASVPCRQALHINYTFYIILYWLSNLILLFVSYVSKPKLINYEDLLKIDTLNIVLHILVPVYF